MKRSQKKILARNNEHCASFKERVLIGQYAAKLRRKEIQRADIPQPILDAIDVETVRNAKGVLKQAEQFMAQHEHVHDENCNHSEPTPKEDAGMTLEQEPLTSTPGDGIDMVEEKSE